MKDNRGLPELRIAETIPTEAASPSLDRAVELGPTTRSGVVSKAQETPGLGLINARGFEQTVELGLSLNRHGGIANLAELAAAVTARSGAKVAA